MEALQDEGNGSCQVITDCLDLPEILSKIMQYFSTTELLQLSLVTKQWNFEARSLMKSRGNLIARLDRRVTCQVVEDFASDLQEMKQTRKVVPFSGMKIELPHLYRRRCCSNSSSGELVPVNEEVLNVMRWKNLSVLFSSGWERHRRCPPFQLVKKILQEYSGVLEELTLRLESTQRQDIEEAFHDCSFPRLKTLRFMRSKNGSIFPALNTKLMKVLVSVAPKLQVLYTEDCVDLRANLIEGSLATLVINYLFCVDFDEIPEDVFGQLRLQQLQLIGMTNFTVDRFNRMTSALLQSSHKTLNFMLVDVMFLIPFTLLGISLENLEDLKINLMYSHLEDCQPRISRLVKSFDFTRIFPNLRKISISSMYLDQSFELMANALNDIVDEGNPAFESVPDRAINIKSLCLKWQPVSDIKSSAPFLAEMFPDIEKLSIQTHRIPFAAMWSCWPDLKELQVTLELRSVLTTELDSALCGLFPEEIAELREKDEEYLKAVNIVPVMPSIACFKGLRTFKLVCDVQNPYIDTSYLISKVTGLIAFQKCPDLAVTVATNSKELEEALSPMKPYASIVPFQLFGLGHRLLLIK